jgi:hypothetical protein
VRGAPTQDGPGWLRRQLPQLAVVAVIGSLALGAVLATRHYDRIAAEQDAANEAARVASRRQALDRGTLAETLRFCRDGWREAFAFHQEPVAVAWAAGRVDGYFTEGQDEHTLRQAKCDARGVERGPRVAHPLHAFLPAEAPAESEVPDEGEAWGLAMAQLPERLAADELAYEVIRHPVTGRVLVRRWRKGAEGATASTDPAAAPPFPLLVAVPAFRPASPPSLAALAVVPRFDWTAQSDAAFAVIARGLPPGARVSEITLDPDKIEVQVAHPTPAFDGKPPAPFGDMEWDEYGVADRGWWYPREIAGFGCEKGRPLAALHADFADAWSRAGARPLARAWYSCSPAYSNGHDGTWHLLPRSQ